MKKTVVGLGEVLWDIFPDYQRPGGAPANVTYHASVLGNDGTIVSRVGEDAKGRELEQFLQGKDLDVSYLQKDSNHDTGIVKVEFKGDEAKYTIVEEVAWDYIEFTDRLKKLASKADAVCFGTLAQRSEVSRSTIRKFLEHTTGDCLKILDVNLREPFYNREILEYSISAADVVKLNEQEFEVLQNLLVGDQSENLLEYLLINQNVKVVCLTKGVDGSELITKNARFVEPRHQIDTSDGDSVGVGDAFTAALTHHMLKSAELDQALALANRYAAHIAAQKGGMPEVPQVIKESVR